MHSTLNGDKITSTHALQLLLKQTHQKYNKTYSSKMYFYLDFVLFLLPYFCVLKASEVINPASQFTYCSI